MKMESSNCPFCGSDIDLRSVVKSIYSLAFVAKHSLHKGQLLVIPRRHVEDFSNLNPEEIQDLMLCAQMAISKLEVYCNIKDYNLILNQGEPAGQTVAHIHMHIVPRKIGDVTYPNSIFSPELFEKLIENSPEEMIEISNEINQISIDAKSDSKVCASAKIIGNVKFGKNVRIESNVIIGQVNYRKLDGNSDSRFDVEIGDSSIIRSGSVIYSGVSIGRYFDCGHNAVIREDSSIGDNVHVLSNTLVNASVSIGDNCRIHGFVCNNAIIQENVSMYGNLVHKYQTPRSGIKEDSPILEKFATVGIGATVIGGVIVGQRSYIGAGAVVTKNVAAGDKVVGNPAMSIYNHQCSGEESD